MIPQLMPVNSGWAQLREAQRLVAKSDSRAELAVINDLGESVDIHPLRKKEVAERISLCFDRLLYNNKVKLAPEVIASEVNDGKIVLTLDQPVQSGKLYTFEVAGDDGKFQNADAIAEGNHIIISSPLASHHSPRIIRYAWKDNPIAANVRSLKGLPMSSFEITINNK